MKFTKYRLGELGRIVTGKTPNTSNPALWNGDVQFVTPEELQHGKNILQTERHLTQQGVKSVCGAFIPAESVCVSCIGNIGYVAKTIYPCVTNQQINTIIPSGAHSSDFLYYKLKSIWHYFKLREGNATTIPILSKSDFANIAIHLPDLPTQLRIAGVLGSLDEKIELNRKKIAELEALAKTIYDYWFVQFDFPDKNGKPYKSSGGKMVWNEKLKREIPAGWEVKPLEKACKRIQSGGTPESNNEAFYSGDIPWFTTQELIDSWVFCSNRSITKSALENSAAKLFPPDTVLLAIYAAPTVGRLAILAKESAFNQACCGFVVGDDISKEYLFLFLYENRNKLNSIADGTAQKNLSVGKMRMFDVLIPTGEIMTLWRNIAEPLFDAIRTDSETAHILSRQRDALLPLLMNEQVSVGELK